MRESLVREAMLGPHIEAARAKDPKHTLQVGQTQLLVWPTVDELEQQGDDHCGPFYIKPEERKAQRIDIADPDKTVTREKRNDELVELLCSNGHVFEAHRNLRKPELLELCRQKELETKVTEPKLLSNGWAGKPKGIIQALWETGWINPEHSVKKYKMSPGKNDLNEDGSIKDSFKEFNLPEVMANRVDFQEEVSDLEALAAEMSTESCTVSVLFSP